MKNIIKHYKTKQEISKDLYKLLENVIPCCNNELQLISNERSDASYMYQLYCPHCRKYICKINWNDEIIK